MAVSVPIPCPRDLPRPVRPSQTRTELRTRRGHLHRPDFPVHQQQRRLPKINRLYSLLKNPDNAAVTRDLYRAILTRAPTADEAKVMESLLASAKDRRLAMEDITWSLVNAKEFLLCR